jgi:hypothetical protein
MPAPVDRHGRVAAMQRGALSGNPRTTAGRGGSALRSERVGFSLGQQSRRSTWRHRQHARANQFTLD